MTVKVVGHWERAWRSPLEEFNSWIHPLREFGVDEFYMCPVSGIDRPRVKERQEVLNVFEENPDLVRVFVDEDADVELQDFVHPENALYVFGKTQFSPLIYKREEDLSVKIPTIANNGGFWADQTLCMLFYDRYIKGGKF